MAGPSIQHFKKKILHMMPDLSGNPAIAHFIHSYLFITGSWIYTQLINMKSFKPFVLTTNLENLDEFPFADVYCRRPRFSGNRLWQIALRKTFEATFHSTERHCIEIIRTRRAKLLHAHFGTEGYSHLGVQRKLGIPLITTFYGADMSQIPQRQPKWKKNYQRLFQAGQLFLAEGPFMAQKLVDLGCPPDKVRVQHLGVDVQRIQFIERNKRSGEPVRFLMTCSFREKKGIPFGIKAFAKALKKYPNMELRIIGGAILKEEQRLMDICKTIAQKEGAADKVFFLGYVPYSEYLGESANSHIFLAPSIHASDGDSEGGAPVSVIEASAAGMPIIASNHCDIPNVVVNGQTGLLVAERDVDALSDAILRLAAAPESWKELGAAGRNRVKKEFDVYTQVERLEQIYAECAMHSQSMTDRERRK